MHAGLDVGVTQEEYRRKLIELKAKVDDVNREWKDLPDGMQYRDDAAKLSLTLRDVLQKYSLALAGWDGALKLIQWVIDFEREHGLPHDKNLDDRSMPNDLKHFLEEASKLTDDADKLYAKLK